VKTAFSQKLVTVIINSRDGGVACILHKLESTASCMESGTLRLESLMTWRSQMAGALAPLPLRQRTDVIVNAAGDGRNIALAGVESYMYTK